MVLTYKFKKERLTDGSYVSRPRILVELKGPLGAVIVPALIDSGADATVIPEGLAKVIGLNVNGKRSELYAYREVTQVIVSTTSITFLGKEYRQFITLENIPVLIALSRAGYKDEEDITLGINGIFDIFEIIFKKSANKIILKKVGMGVSKG